MTRRLTANASVFTILDALRRAGWGVLRGPAFRCHRAILDSLVAASRNQRSDYAGFFTITTNQLADRAGYTDRHIRACLPDLEDLGVITWHRGGVMEGRPRPGHMRINKKTLVDLVHAARPVYDRLLNERRRETSERLRKLNRTVLFPQKPRRVSADNSHAEMNSCLPLNRRASATSALAHAQKASPAVDTAVKKKGQTELRVITFQSYMNKKYPNAHTDLWALCDIDPVAQELAERGAMTYDEIRRLETDSHLEHANLTGVSVVDIYER